MASTFPAHARKPLRFPIIVIGLSVVLTLPALVAGYMADDYFFTGGAIAVDAPFGYYNFTERNIATEIQPWWTSPEFKIRFFRPLSSLSLHLDFTLFRGHPLPAHVHSLAWFVLLLVGAYRLLVHVLPAKASKWAMVLFSLSVIHAWGAGWIAARHAVMGGALSVWAALSYLCFRENDDAPKGMVSAALFVLGLLTSEVALSVWGFVIACEVVFSDRPLSDRLRAMAPITAISLVYLVFYESMGFGTAGSDLYNDPFFNPVVFIVQLPLKVLALMGAFVFGVPASVRVLPGGVGASLGAGVAGSLLIIGGLVSIWSRLGKPERRAVTWLLLMGGLTLFPSIAGIAQGREFPLTGIAVMGVAALVLTNLFSAAGTWKRRIVPYALGGLIFFGTLVLSPLARVGMGYLIYKHAAVSKRIGESPTGCPEGSNVLVVTGNFDIPIIYAPHLVASYQTRFFKSWHQLAVSDNPITLSRPAIDRIVLSAKEALVDTLLLREKENPLKAGEKIERRNMTIEVVKLADKGPSEVAIQFKQPGDVDSVCVLKTEEAILKQITLPEVGQSITVAYKPYL